MIVRLALQTFCDIRCQSQSRQRCRMFRSGRSNRRDSTCPHSQALISSKAHRLSQNFKFFSKLAVHYPHRSHLKVANVEYCTCDEVVHPARNASTSSFAVCFKILTFWKSSGSRWIGLPKIQSASPNSRRLVAGCSHHAEIGGRMRGSLLQPITRFSGRTAGFWRRIPVLISVL